MEQKKTSTYHMRIPDDMLSKIDELLSIGESRSDFVRQAIRNEIKWRNAEK